VSVCSINVIIVTSTAV